METTSGQSSDLEQRIAQRDALHEREIRAGLRDPQSLVLLPKELVQRARLTFPTNAFGEPQDW